MVWDPSRPPDHHDPNDTDIYTAVIHDAWPPTPSPYSKNTNALLRSPIHRYGSYVKSIFCPTRGPDTPCLDYTATSDWDITETFALVWQSSSFISMNIVDAILIQSTTLSDMELQIHRCVVDVVGVATTSVRVKGIIFIRETTAEGENIVCLYSGMDASFQLFRVIPLSCIDKRNGKVKSEWITVASKKRKSVASSPARNQTSKSPSKGSARSPAQSQKIVNGGMSLALHFPIDKSPYNPYGEHSSSILSNILEASIHAMLFFARHDHAEHLVGDTVIVSNNVSEDSEDGLRLGMIRSVHLKLPSSLLTFGILFDGEGFIENIDSHESDTGTRFSILQTTQKTRFELYCQKNVMIGDILREVFRYKRGTDLREYVDAVVTDIELGENPDDVITFRVLYINDGYKGGLYYNNNKDDLLFGRTRCEGMFYKIYDMFCRVS